MVTVVESQFNILKYSNPYELVDEVTKYCYGKGVIEDLYLCASDEYLINRHAHASFFVVSDVGLHQYLENIPDIIVSNLRPYQYLVTVSLASIDANKLNNDLIQGFYQILHRDTENTSEYGESTVTIFGLKSTIVYLSNISDVTQICDLSDKQVTDLVQKHRFISVYAKCSKNLVNQLSSLVDVVTVESPNLFKHRFDSDSNSISVIIPNHFSKKNRAELNTRVTDYLEYCESSYLVRDELSMDVYDNYNLLPGCVCVYAVLTSNQQSWSKLYALASSLSTSSQKELDSLLKLF